MEYRYNREMKEDIMDILLTPIKGTYKAYKTYAKILSYFDVYSTDEPDFVAAMIPGKAMIIINENLSDKQISTIVRHEILHEWFTHAERQAELIKNNPDIINNHDIANIAGDFDISNKGYTEDDKDIARAIILGDKTLRGLVTEDEHPGWEHKSFEEMLTELSNQLKKEKEKLQPLLDLLSKLNSQNMDDLEKEIDEMDKRAARRQNGEPDDDDDDNDNSDDDDDGKIVDPGGLPIPLNKKGKSKKGDAQDGEPMKGSPTSDSDDVDKAQKKLDNEIDDLKDDFDDVKKKVDAQDKKKKGHIMTEEEQQRRATYAERVEEIHDIFHDVEMKERALSEVSYNKRQDQIAKEIRNQERLQAEPLRQFKINLDRFIKNEVSRKRQIVPYMNSAAHEHSGYFVPRTMSIKSENVPVINVYWDVSGSFSDEAKTAGAKAAINLLRQYQQKGLIQKHEYYFATKVSDTVQGANPSSTNGRPIQKHIQATRPDNVIIITDGDISDCYDTVKVPGAVWMLFYITQSSNLMSHILGRQETKYYKIM